MKNLTKIALVLLVSFNAWTCAAPSVRDKSSNILWSAKGNAGICNKKPRQALEPNGLSGGVSARPSHEKVTLEWRIEHIINQALQGKLRVSYKIHNDSLNVIYVLDRYVDQKGKLIPMMNIQNSEESGAVELIKGFVYTYAKPATLKKPEVSAVLPSVFYEDYAEIPLPVHYLWNYSTEWETESLFKKIMGFQIWISYFSDSGQSIPWLYSYEKDGIMHRAALLCYIANNERWLCTSTIKWTSENR